MVVLIFMIAPLVSSNFSYYQLCLLFYIVYIIMFQQCCKYYTVQAERDIT